MIYLLMMGVPPDSLSVIQGQIQWYAKTLAALVVDSWHTITEVAMVLEHEEARQLYAIWV